MGLGPLQHVTPDEIDCGGFADDPVEFGDRLRVDIGEAFPTNAEINDLIEACFDLAEIHGVSGRKAVAVITKALKKRVDFERLKRKHDVRQNPEDRGLGVMVGRGDQEDN